MRQETNTRSGYLARDVCHLDRIRGVVTIDKVSGRSMGVKGCTESRASRSLVYLYCPSGSSLQAVSVEKTGVGEASVCVRELKVSSCNWYYLLIKVNGNINAEHACIMMTIANKKL